MHSDEGCCLSGIMQRRSELTMVKKAEWFFDGISTEGSYEAKARSIRRKEKQKRKKMRARRRRRFILAGAIAAAAVWANMDDEDKTKDTQEPVVDDAPGDAELQAEENLKNAEPQAGDDLESAELQAEENLESAEPHAGDDLECAELPGDDVLKDNEPQSDDTPEEEAQVAEPAEDAAIAEETLDAPEEIVSTADAPVNEATEEAASDYEHAPEEARPAGIPCSPDEVDNMDQPAIPASPDDVA